MGTASSIPRAWIGASAMAVGVPSVWIPEAFVSSGWDDTHSEKSSGGTRLVIPFTSFRAGSGAKPKDLAFAEDGLLGHGPDSSPRCDPFRMTGFGARISPNPCDTQTGQRYLSLSGRSVCCAGLAGRRRGVVFLGRRAEQLGEDGI